MVKKIFSLGVAAAAACLFSFAVSAEPVTSPTNLRSGPGLKWPVLAAIPAGTDVDIVNCYGGWKHDWCNVHYNGFNGFVLAYTLAPSPSGNNVWVAPVVTTDLANVRKGPGKNWPVVAVIQPGSAVNVLSCTGGWLYRWCKVDVAGTTGYVNNLLLKRQGALFTQ
jgi:uncharacterized protein YraI